MILCDFAMVEILNGKNTILRPVRVDDAFSIIEMRNNPTINKFLSSNKTLTIEDQRDWLEANLGASDQYYFLVLNNSGIVVGTISIYNIKNGCAEFGRYICTNAVQAVEAELMILEFTFKHLGLSYLYCRTAQSNESVWRQHYRFGFTDCGIDFDPHLNFNLHIQGITREAYQAFDYSKIEQLINRFQG